MCGIFSINSLNRNLEDVRFIEGTKKALNKLSHRGPDGSGILVKSSAILGHRRLSIIDIASGQQPMVTRDKKIGITYNGEVYNYVEIKNELINLGHKFETDSDTEVVLKAYSQYGVKCLQKLRGMFAFVIVNFETKEFFAARDRFGIKPLYYSKQDDFYIFSSEIRPMLFSGLMSLEINSKKFEEYLVFGYIAGQETLHQNVKEVEGGHYLYISHDKKEYKRYWHPGNVPKKNISFEDAVNELDTKLYDAVKYWSVSDVEVGSLLSGGIDSSLITAIAKKILGKVNTFSLGFPEDKDVDESQNIRNIKKILKVQNTLIDFNEIYIHDSLKDLTDHFDEPLVDPNNYSLMSLCKHIKNLTDIKVVLCGEGADELFGGYPRHRQISNEFRDNPEDKLILMSLNKVALPRLDLIGANTRFSQKNREKITYTLYCKDAVNRVLEHDQLTFLTTRLHSQDRIGMYYGLEIRTPFLEHTLTDFVNGLPGEYKIHSQWSKYILRNVAQKYLPKSNIWEKKKIGLSIPYSRMLHEGPLRNVFEEMVKNDGKVSKYFSVKKIHELLNLHEPFIEGHDHSNTLWRILALELWLRSF